MQGYSKHEKHIPVVAAASGDGVGIVVVGDDVGFPVGSVNSVELAAIKSVSLFVRKVVTLYAGNTVVLVAVGFAVGMIVEMALGFIVGIKGAIEELDVVVVADCCAKAVIFIFVCFYFCIVIILFVWNMNTARETKCKKGQLNCIQSNIAKTKPPMSVKG